MATTHENAHEFIHRVVIVGLGSFGREVGDPVIHHGLQGHRSRLNLLPWRLLCADCLYRKPRGGQALKFHFRLFDDFAGSGPTRGVQRDFNVEDVVLDGGFHGVVRR